MAGSALLVRVLLRDPRHGHLPAQLVALTVLTGVVDAVSILRLGRVFVANMTGNVVFVGFALSGAKGFSLSASVTALAGFLLGAATGGRLTQRWHESRPALLRAGAGSELVLVTAALVVSLAAGEHRTSAVQAVLAGLSALAMGVQNAVVRRLAVPDLTTTVLTMTLTGIAADLRTPGAGPGVTRRVLAVGAMLGGAVAGAELVLRVNVSAALGLAVAILAAVTASAAVSARRPAPWHNPT